MLLSNKKITNLNVTTLAANLFTKFESIKKLFNETKVKHNIKWLIALVTAIASLTQPLSTQADISYSTSAVANNPIPTRENIDLVAQAISLLVSDPRLAGHPINDYLYDNSIKSEIIFDNPLVKAGESFSGGSRMYVRSGSGLEYYVRMLAHEFIHIAMADRYLSDGSYSFLIPEHFAFQYVMEEAFAGSLDIWLRQSYPGMNPDRQIRNWQVHQSTRVASDAMWNDLRATTSLSDAQISDKVAAEIFNINMTSAGTYTIGDIPSRIRSEYKTGSRFLIPEYNAYRDRGEALLRHQWNYLASMMPFELPPEMSYDHFRAGFKDSLAFWARFADEPERSVLYWTTYDYDSAARARYAPLSPYEKTFHYMSRADEARMNRAMREIDPYFRPVDTSNTEWRLWQENLHGINHGDIR